MVAHSKIKLAENLTDLLENKFKIGPFKFGLDPIIGLVPILGDIIPAIMSAYLVYIAIVEKVAKPVILKMILLIVIDYVVGSIPIVGDITDFFFKAYSHNLKTLKKELNIK